MYVKQTQGAQRVKDQPQNKAKFTCHLLRHHWNGPLEGEDHLKERLCFRAGNQCAINGLQLKTGGRRNAGESCLSEPLHCQTLPLK